MAIPRRWTAIGLSLIHISADIAGGKNAGMKTIWYNHTHRPVPERCEADQIVDSLLKLKNLL